MCLKQFSLIFLFPALILAFPAESDVDVRGLFALDVLCLDPLGKPLPNCESCSNFEGRKCVGSNECLDIPTRDHGENSIVIRNAQLDFNQSTIAGFNAVCPNDEDVCCKKILEIDTDITKNCADDPDYHCVGIQDCSSGILKGPTKEVLSINRTSLNRIDFTNNIIIRQGGVPDLLEEIFEGNSVHIEIDNRKTTCKKDIEVCCKKKPARTPPTPSTRPPVNPVPPTTKPPPPQKCGIHNSKGLEVTASFPSDGQASTHAGEWPHSCLLFDKSKPNNFIGGATLIAPGVIITAAHKVEQISELNLFVRCGDWDIHGTEEMHPHQDRNVRYKIIHPLYTGTRGTSKKVNYNFAVLHLEKDFDLDVHINPICLPDIPDKKTGQFGHNCIATGWGKSKFVDQKYQQSMKQVHLPLVGNKKCQQQLRNARNNAGRPMLNQDFNLHESFNCAGGEENVDTCEGDGGSPLVCPKLDDSSRFVLSGIVSWGLECGKKDVPGVYADVTQGLCFVDYATKCIHGKKYQQFYDYPQCNNWLEDLIANLNSSHNGFDVRQGSLKKAIDLRDTCNGFSSRNPLFDPRNANN